jgi:hypothetical protein
MIEICPPGFTGSGSGGLSRRMNTANITASLGVPTAVELKFV